MDSPFDDPGAVTDGAVRIGAHGIVHPDGSGAGHVCGWLILYSSSDSGLGSSLLAHCRFLTIPVTAPANSITPKPIRPIPATALILQLAHVGQRSRPVQ
jgi:hypothetical protein